MNNLLLASDLASDGNLGFCAEWRPGQACSGRGYSARKARSISVVASSAGTHKTAQRDVKGKA